MTPSIAPSIFLRTTLIQKSWQLDTRSHMTSKHLDSSSSKNLASTAGAMDSGEVKKLLTRISEKDVQALSVLYKAYSGMLMGVILAVLKDKGESEDILQESFLAIWNKASMYQPHLGKATSWMVTIAKNKAYDRYRKLMRQNEGISALRETVHDKPLVSQVESIPDNELLKEGFNELNDDQREAIELVYYQGYTQQEVAKKIDAPLGTVKARIRRGLLKLKQILKQH